MKQHEAVAILLNVAYEADVEKDNNYNTALRTVSQLIEHCRLPDGSSVDDNIECKRYVPKRKQLNMNTFLIGFGIGVLIGLVVGLFSI